MLDSIKKQEILKRSCILAELPFKVFLIIGCDNIFSIEVNGALLSLAMNMVVHNSLVLNSKLEYRLKFWTTCY